MTANSIRALYNHKIQTMREKLHEMLHQAINKGIADWSEFRLGFKLLMWRDTKILSSISFLVESIILKLFKSILQEQSQLWWKILELLEVFSNLPVRGLLLAYWPICLKNDFWLTNYKTWVYLYWYNWTHKQHYLACL